MKILALDSSGPACSAALWEGGVIIAASLLQNGNTHSVSLMPMLENMLESCGSQVCDIDYIACVTGPGSFTGVRIGVSTARALSAAINAPCIPVNALEALAYRSFVGTVCPMLDARRSQVYCAAFASGKRLMEDAAIPLEQFLADVKRLEAPYLFVGDGAKAYEEAVIGGLGSDAVFVKESETNIASAAAALAANMTEKALLRHDLMPYYLRVPQAEREYAQKHDK